MPTYIGLVTTHDANMSTGDLVDIGKSARAWTNNHGGRILSLYWPDEWESKVIITFEGRGKEQAKSCFNDLEKQHGVTIASFRALTQGEKEHEQKGMLWTS